ncbi:MAG TPA: guanylate kinase [Chlamydiales bacterium]|nr:guanylate kinase [Chlamydiales bacterium]
MGNSKRGLVFIISGPSAAGKTTLVGMLCKEFACVEKSISFTTRAPRTTETPGIDYHFISVAEFEQKIENGDFLEHAKVFDHYYGTSKHFVETETNKGKHLLLVIDTQGAIQLMDTYEAIFIFIRPPSIEELPKRMHFRKADTHAVIEHRLSWAEKEIALASHYDYCIVNDDLTVAYQVLRSILIAEEHKNH